MAELTPSVAAPCCASERATCCKPSGLALCAGYVALRASANGRVCSRQRCLRRPQRAAISPIVSSLATTRAALDRFTQPPV